MFASSADAKLSAGAPSWICLASVLEESKLNFTSVTPGLAFLKSSPIFLNGSVSDAAADTVIAPVAAPPVVPGVEPGVDAGVEPEDGATVVAPPDPLDVVDDDPHAAPTNATETSMASRRCRCFRTVASFDVERARGSR